MELRTIVVGPLAENCYVLWEDPDEAFVVDPGDEGARIVEELGRWGVTPRLVVNTHGHFDHTGAVGRLVEEFGAEYRRHRADDAIVEMTPAGSRVWGMSVAPVPEPDGGLEHGETLDVGGLRIEVLHTPGHTPGSTCFLVPSAGLVMTGDTLFQGSIGRSDFPGGDGELLGRSIQQRLYSLADATRVLSGHGPATTIGREATSNPFVRRRA